MSSYSSGIGSSTSGNYFNISCDIANSRYTTTGITYTTTPSWSTGSWIGSTYSDSYNTINEEVEEDFTEKCLDIEKLEKMSESKRDMVYNIFLKYIDCNDVNQKKLLYNTLCNYKVFVNKKSLERNSKINSLFENKNTLEGDGTSS